MEPNFQRMTKEELRTYVLNHRDDEAAFYVYMDKLHAQEDRVKHPATNSFDELENYPEFARKLQQEARKQQ